MPVSVMKFVTVRAPATEYKLMFFRFGGGEFFAGKGYGNFDYVAGILVGPNPALLMDRVDGDGLWSVERAGYINDFDLIAAWKYILRHFDDLAEESVMMLERNAGGDWNVKSVSTISIKGGD